MTPGIPKGCFQHPQDVVHDFDEDILKTQLQIFSKNFPLKEQLSIIDIENYFKELEPSSRKLLSEVGKILELVLVLPATNATSRQKISKMGLIKTRMIFSTHKEEVDKGPSINDVSSEGEGGGLPSKPIYYISLFSNLS